MKNLKIKWNVRLQDEFWKWPQFLSTIKVFIIFFLSIHSKPVFLVIMMRTMSGNWKVVMNNDYLVQKINFSHSVSTWSGKATPRGKGFIGSIAKLFSERIIKIFWIFFMALNSLLKYLLFQKTAPILNCRKIHLTQTS